MASLDRQGIGFWWYCCRYGQLWDSLRLDYEIEKRFETINRKVRRWQIKCGTTVHQRCNVNCDYRRFSQSAVNSFLWAHYIGTLATAKQSMLAPCLCAVQCKTRSTCWHLQLLRVWLAVLLLVCMQCCSTSPMLGKKSVCAKLPV